MRLHVMWMVIHESVASLILCQVSASKAYQSRGTNGLTCPPKQGSHWGFHLRNSFHVWKSNSRSFASKSEQRQRKLLFIYIIYLTYFFNFSLMVTQFKVIVLSLLSITYKLIHNYFHRNLSFNSTTSFGNTMSLCQVT